MAMIIRDNYDLRSLPETVTCEKQMNLCLQASGYHGQ